MLMLWEGYLDIGVEKCNSNKIIIQEMSKLTSYKPCLFQL